MTHRAPTQLATRTARLLERSFLRWLDPAQYTLLPGGTFEASLPGWSLTGAKVASGNEPYYVHGINESRSLSLPAGTKATAAWAIDDV